MGRKARIDKDKVEMMLRKGMMPAEIAEKMECTIQYIRNIKYAMKEPGDGDKVKVIHCQACIYCSKQTCMYKKIKGRNRYEQDPEKCRGWRDL